MVEYKIKQFTVLEKNKIFHEIEVPDRELDDKGCKDTAVQFEHEVQRIQEILAADSKKSQQSIQHFTEEKAQET